MIIKNNFTIAITCPQCTKVFVKNITPFDFSGTKEVKISCAHTRCNEHTATITKKSDYYSINAICSVCGDTHIFKIPNKRISSKENLMCNCSYAEIPILAVGTDETVKKELEYLISDYDDEDFFDASDDPIDLLYEIMEKLEEMYYNKKISCVCGSCDISLNLNGEQIVLSCTECGKHKYFKIKPDTLATLTKTKVIVIGK